jgi:hypothetical protein
MQASLFAPPQTLDDKRIRLQVESDSGVRHPIVFSPYAGGKRLPEGDCPPGVNASHVMSVVNKYRWAEYSLKSAFHKEVRRGDHDRGFAYARWIHRHLGPKGVRRYCRQILFEETRNIDLMRYFESVDDGSAMEMASRLLRSAKKHDLASRQGAYEKYVRAFSEVDKIVESGDLPTDEEVLAALNSGDVRRPFRMHWIAYRRKDDHADTSFLSRITRVFQKWASAHSEDGRYLSEGPWSVYPFYPFKIISEMSGGMYDAESASYVAPDAGQRAPLYIPSFRPYVFDNHSMEGMAVYSKHVVNLRPGEQPPHPRLDPRWSGLLRGVYWRDYAARARPDWRECDWELFNLDANVWRDTLRVDGWFYKKLYERAGLKPDGSPQ